MAGGKDWGDANGPASEARFQDLAGIVADPVGNLYVVDRDNYLIRKVSPSGMVTTVAGSGIAGYDDGAAAKARFHRPFGIAYKQPDLSFRGHTLFLTDMGNHSIRKIALE